MMQRGVREADPQTRKTKFGPTFYVFKIEDVERGPELRGPLTWTAFGSPLCIIRSSNFVFKRPKEIMNALTAHWRLKNSKAVRGC